MIVFKKFVFDKLENIFGKGQNAFKRVISQGS